MYQNEAIGQNTLHVNDMLVRIFKIALVAAAAVVIVKAAGFIALPWPHMIAMAGVAGIAGMLPIACRHFRMEANTLKYVNIYCTSVLCIAGYAYLNMGIIMLLSVPVGFACLYFDSRLIGHAAVLSVAALLLREALGGGINLGLAVHILQFAIVAVLLAAISKRALKMLSNTHSFYENINDIFSNAHASTQSLEVAEDALLQGVSSLGGNNEKNDEAQSTAEEDTVSSNTKVKAIISNINKSMENAKEIMKYTHTMLKGKGKDIKVGDEVVRIEEYTQNSKELIAKLSKHTEKIKADLSLISVMVDESKLLSMNAAAEAENASSGGKGSAIVAMKVEKLADETVESASHIQELLNSIVNDAENTVESVAKTYEEVFKSLELINRTVETLIKWLMYKNMK
ncbi:MAG TPA: methyl-accepting chemotaxis protein [Candidatus Nitrosocosmicus sp.]|nr:methyl-accepting chemotaxis protein [Candidatus Nitrosocosmicus sp.]